jgi:hypothetical protein
MGSEWIWGKLAVGGMDWIRLAQNRRWWRAAVNSVMNFRILVPWSSLNHGCGVTLTTHPHLVLRSRMSTVYTSCPTCHLLGSSRTLLCLCQCQFDVFFHDCVNDHHFIHFHYFNLCKTSETPLNNLLHR